MKRRLLGMVVVAGVLLAACGYRGGTIATSKQTDVLTVAIGVDPDTLDPMRQTTTTVLNIVQMVAESLATVDQTGKIQPDLATGWQEAPDGLSWVFTLRQGVTFSDGAPFDAAAVKANLDRIIDPKSVCPLCGALARNLRSTDVVDAGHVRLNLALPLASDIVLGLLASGPYDFVSPRTIQVGTPAYTRQEQPVGTGPYVLEKRVPGDHVTLRRNDDYWGRRPVYARQVYKVVPDSATREALVRSGQAQVTVAPPISDLPSLEADQTVKVLLAPSDRMIYFAINTQDSVQPLLRNPQVRQALNYAINRDAIIKSTLFGAGDPLTSPVASSLFGYCPASNPYKYDPDLARSLLQKANASGLSISLIAPTGRYIQDFQAAQNIANDLRAVGVTVNGPRTMDWPSYVSTIVVPPAKASADMHMLGFAPGYLDAAQAMTQFDPTLQPPKGLETSYYDNPSVTALIQKAQVETNRDARAQEYCAAEQQIWSDAPWLFLWMQKFPIVYSQQVTGVGSVPNESLVTVYAQPA